MDSFENRFRRVCRVCLLVGIAFLIAITLVIVANVIVRGFLGGVIQGVWEFTSVMLIVVAVFGILYAVLEQANVAIDIVTTRFPRRAQEILKMFTSVISLGIVVVILWSTIDWLVGGAWRGQTGALRIPYLPFQIVWVFGLMTVCLALLLDVYKALKRQ